MYANDDRVYTLAKDLDLTDRIISINYDDSFNYNKEKNYEKYNNLLIEKRKKSINYLKKTLLIGDDSEKSK